MASLDSQGEIAPKVFPNPEEPQIWEGENKPACSCRHLHLQLLLAYNNYCPLNFTQWML